MSGSLSTEVKAEPNLVPILDMVFQLITFFMLVMTFATAGVDKDLKLPVVGSARPVETRNEDLLVLSIGLDKDASKEAKKDVYCLKYLAQPISNVRAFIAEEGENSRLAAKMKVEEVATVRNIKNCRTEEEREKLKELPARVVIRADRKAPYKVVDEVLVACQNNGYRNFVLKAMSAEPKLASRK
jgi:biopolymer transport protein ExbD